MDLNQLADLGDFIGGAAVLVTLVYLAVQMRQTTRQGAATLTYMFQAEFQKMNETTLTNPEHAELLLKLGNDAELDPLESIRAVAHANRITNQWWSAQVAYDLQLIQPDYFSALEADVRRTVAERPTLRRYIHEILVHYSNTRSMRIFKPFFAGESDNDRS